MTNRERFFLTLTLTLVAAMALPLYGYNDKLNHRTMTIIATEKSVLYTDPSIMFALGLQSPERERFLRPSPDGTLIYTLSQFMALGAVEEDQGSRPVNHFYDPVHDRAIIPIIAYKSWEWSLEENAAIFGQDRSLRDARDLLTRALTFNEGTPAESAKQRDLAVTAMLLSVGHVLHHMQDMASPQHVRHDQHIENGFTNFFRISNPSRFEHYTADHDAVVAKESHLATPVFPRQRELRTARDFWFNAAGSGIAQWVNRDFLSQGTNFVATDTNVNPGRFPQPAPVASRDYTVAELYAESGMDVPPKIQILCGIPVYDCKMTMYSTPVSERASTLSIFNQDMMVGGTQVVVDRDGFRIAIKRFFDLNRFNFDDAHKHLIKRAVSYSAGFVNHFFRGKLQISPPATGPYAVVDHSTSEGFKTIRATVTNATPEEMLTGGSIRAIARFRRNLCYQPDLTGEFRLDGTQIVPPACPQIRSTDSYVRVSVAEPVFFNVGEAKVMTFKFADPIPLDAIELVLHVYYTGRVGDEAESFALGAVDVSEPTFIAFMNGTDVFGLSGTFYYGEDIRNNITVTPYSQADQDHNGQYNSPPDLNVDGENLFFEISLDDEKVGDTGSVPQGRFARIAAIVDRDAGVSLRLNVVGRMTVVDELDARLFQFYEEGGWRITIAEKLRGQTTQFDSATFFRYHGTIPSIDSMPPSKAVDAQIPVPVYTVDAYRLGAATSNGWTSSIDVFRAMSSNAFAPMLPMRASQFTARTAPLTRTLTMPEPARRVIRDRRLEPVVQ